MEKESTELVRGGKGALLQENVEGVLMLAIFKVAGSKIQIADVLKL